MIIMEKEVQHLLCIHHNQYDKQHDNTIIVL